MLRAGGGGIKREALSLVKLFERTAREEALSALAVSAIVGDECSVLPRDGHRAFRQEHG